MRQRKYLILLALLGFVVSFDQLTKTMVTGRMRLGESIPVIENFFSITLVHNPGAAFGLLAGLDASIREVFFLVVPVLTLLAILYVFHQLQDSQRISIFALSSIVGGAVGNLFDRARMGYVIDFLDFHWYSAYHFPAFNVADSAITIGVGLLLLTIVLEKEKIPPA